MTKQTQTLDGVSRRKEILRAASNVFAANGFANSTVRDVAKKSGILSGSLYYHFTSKEEMLLEILDEAFGGLLGAYSEAKDVDPPRLAIEHLVLVGLRFQAEQRESATIIQNEFDQLRRDPAFASITAMYEEIREIWRSVLLRAKRSGILRHGVDIDIAHRAIMGSILSTVWWYNPAGKLSVDEVACQHAEIFLDGICR